MEECAALSSSKKTISRRALLFVLRVWCVRRVRFSIQYGGLHAKNCISQTLFAGNRIGGGCFDVARGGRCAARRDFTNPPPDSNARSDSYSHSAIYHRVVRDGERERDQHDDSPGYPRARVY